MSDTPSDYTYTEAETEARREAALQVMFKTPHKPHKPKRGGKPKPAPSDQKKVG